ncbi:competence protein ComK [Dubosiella newyorkensis]|uniref:competence protein ComK n=1 Tax=Dubosiella newyorkensis TaxID=1862672 RepID=UPI0034E3A657
MLNYLKYDYLRSRVQADFNDHTHLYSFKTIKKLINEMCLYFGSSLEGRKASFQYHMNIRKHVPIYIRSISILRSSYLRSSQIFGSTILRSKK